MAVAEFFSFRDDWHQDDRARPLVRQYQQALDAVLREYPDLGNCAVACCHCGIRFLTHPRNALRRDLGCPFGCRDHHRCRRSQQRSQAYYRTDSGRRKKKRLNARRRAEGDSTGNASQPAGDSSTVPVESPAVESVVVSASRPGDSTPGASWSAAAADADLGLPLDGFVLDEVTLINSRVLPYLQLVVRLLEGRRITREELLAMLGKSLRQRSIGRRPRREYVLRYLRQHPP